jgi:quercetin dioxygenase-like cupin family protein
MSEFSYRQERLTHTQDVQDELLEPGVRLKLLAGAARGSLGLATGIVEFSPGATLPYHHHPCCEAIVVISGSLEHIVEGRRYELGPYDAIHVPAGTLHMARASRNAPLTRALASFADGMPTRTLVDATFGETNGDASAADAPERVVRLSSTPKYELAMQTEFATLFEGRSGCDGICGGYGRFEPGAGLPCHTHDYDESITIVEGEAVCYVAGRQHWAPTLSSVTVPRGAPHRFVNRSNEPMAMIWVYAGSRPDRVIVDPCRCEPSHAGICLSSP